MWRCVGSWGLCPGRPGWGPDSPRPRTVAAPLGAAPPLPPGSLWCLESKTEGQRRRWWRNTIGTREGEEYFNILTSQLIHSKNRWVLVCHISQLSFNTLTQSWREILSFVTKPAVVRVRPYIIKAGCRNVICFTWWKYGWVFTLTNKITLNSWTPDISDALVCFLAWK